MRVGQTNIKEIIDKGQDKANVPAVEIQQWLQGHYNISTCGQKFVRDNITRLAKALLPEDKVKILLSILRSPFKSSELMGEAYEKLQSVMNPRNASENWGGSETSVAAAKEWLSGNDTVGKFRATQFELFKRAPNSLIVIDSKIPDGKDKAEPYIAYVDVSKLFQFEMKDDGVHFSWAIFKESEDKYFIYNETVWASWVRVDKTQDFIWTESNHGIGRCPVLFLLQEKGDSNNLVLKKTQMINQLPVLDEYVLSKSGFYNQKTTSIFPILVTLENKCEYGYTSGEDNSFVRTECVGGKLTTNGQFTGMDCPMCSGKQLAGAGAVIQKPIPTADQPDIQNGVSFVSPSIADIEFTSTDLDSIENRFMVAVTGQASNNVLASQAINKDQVRANKEAAETILQNIAKQFGFSESWTIETLVRAKYQTQKLTYERNGGTEFHTRTEQDLVLLIGEAKTNGLSSWYIDNLNKELAELINRNNPIAKKRQEVITAIEPFPSLSIEDASKVSPAIALQKLVLSEFIRDYELNNGSIAEYEKEEYRIHINKLKELLIKFSERYEQTKELESRDDSTIKPRDND